MKNSTTMLLFFSDYPHQPTDMKIKSSEKKKFNPLLLAGKQKTKTDLADNPKNWDETWFGNYE